jgi:hypothetical protein
MAKKKSFYVDFKKEPAVPLFAKTTNAIATGADTQEDYFAIRGIPFEHIQNGANSVIQYGVSASGWVPPMDAATDGLEITNGIVSGIAPSFTIGTDAAFFIRVGFKVTTIARSTVFAVGFRKLGAYSATNSQATARSAYTDQAWIGWTAATGVLETNTSVGGSDVTTALAHAAIADATWGVFEVKVSAAGAVTYRLGTSLVSEAAALAALAADANAVAESMTNGLEFVPTIIMEGAAAGAGTLALLTYEVGLQ